MEIKQEGVRNVKFFKIKSWPCWKIYENDTFRYQLKAHGQTILSFSFNYVLKMKVCLRKFNHLCLMRTEINPWLFDLNLTFFYLIEFSIWPIELPLILTDWRLASSVRKPPQLGKTFNSRGLSSFWHIESIVNPF